MSEFQKFEDLTSSRVSRDKIGGVAYLLKPFSVLLHYLEGDSVPISHLYPCFQILYDFAQQLDSYSQINSLLEEDEQREAVCSAVRERWLGIGRRVGLKHDVHLCAFALDPYAQAIFSSRLNPECSLFASDVHVAARNTLKHLAGSDVALRSVLIQQYCLWIAASHSNEPASSSNHDDNTAGNIAYGPLYQTAVELMWDKVSKRKRDAESCSTSNEEFDSVIESVSDLLADLKLCPNPVSFWLAMAREPPKGATAQAIEAHRSFCYTSRDTLSIAGHSAGVERAGKCYKLVMTAQRERLEPARVKMLSFIYSNYGLLHKLQEVGDGYSAFSQDESDVHSHAGRRHQHERLILEDEPGEECSESSSENDDENEDVLSGDGIERIGWRLPPGFAIAQQPVSIDAACVGRQVYMNWSNFGWQMGTVSALITASTPRLFRRYNARVAWQDGHGPCSLDLACYKHGSDAPVDSWVFLDLVADLDD